MQKMLIGAGGVVAAVVLAAGTASAAGGPHRPATDTLDGQTASATPTPTATGTARPGGPPADRGNGNRPETPGRSAETPERGNRPESAGPGASGTPGRPENGPQLPAQASPRAKAAVEAAARKHDLLRQRLAALKAIPRDTDRAEAVRAVMTDFSDLFHLVSDAVHSVDAKPPTTGSPTATGTATGTATATPTATARP